MNITRNEMLYHLRSDVCTVTFEKVDGTERTMKCTLVEDHIPEENRAKSDRSRLASYSKLVIRAYDVEENGWRSFRVASVKSFLLPSYFQWRPETQDMDVINSVET